MLHSYFKSLSLLLLCITATTQGMEPEDNNLLAPITWAQTYHGLSELLLPELMPLIFSFHLYTSGIDYEKLPTLIKDSYESPSLFIKLVDTLLKLGNDTLVTEVLECGFTHTNVSIYDIQRRSDIDDKSAWTVLHSAAIHGNLEAVKLILKFADKQTWIRPDEHHTLVLNWAARRNYPKIVVNLLLDATDETVWTLLTTKDSCGNTALRYAATGSHSEIVKLLLNAAGKRAQEFMAIRNNGGKTAFYIASPEVKEVMKKYYQNNL